MRASKPVPPVKVIILPLFASFSWQRLHTDMGMRPIETSISDELFSHINNDDLERPWIPKIRGFIVFLQSSAAAHTSRVNSSEVAGDRLRQYAIKNCYKLLCISWALAQISCNPCSATSCYGSSSSSSSSNNDTKSLMV